MVDEGLDIRLHLEGMDFEDGDVVIARRSLGDDRAVEEYRGTADEGRSIAGARRLEASEPVVRSRREVQTRGFVAGSEDRYTDPPRLTERRPAGRAVLCREPHEWWIE